MYNDAAKIEWAGEYWFRSRGLFFKATLDVLYCKRPVELRFPGFRNRISFKLGAIGHRSGKKFIYGRLKKQHPAVEMSGRKRMFLVQIEVFLDWITPVAIRRAEQQEFPECVHDREVCRPVNLCYVVENITDDIILLHFAIEMIDQGFDVGSIRDIVHLEVALMPVFFQPAFFFFVIGHVLRNQCPKPVGVVEFDQVR